MNDTEEEDLALYGDSLPEDSGPLEGVGVSTETVNSNETPIPNQNSEKNTDGNAQVAEKPDEAVAANDAPPSGKAPESEPREGLADVFGEDATEAKELTTTEDNSLVEKESNTPSADGSGGKAGETNDANAQNTSDLGNEKTDSEGKTEADGDAGGSHGENAEDGEDGEDGDGDSEEDDEDDSEDDDFEVVLNYDDTDTQPKPPNASFGSIGKVRLSSNKWQRPGYVPPERVIGAPTQGAARTGGVLSMLPTPTMQIGGSQKSVYDLEIGKLTEKPWLDRNADLSDYFNYGFNEDTWKLYCERQKQMRLEASMLAKIKTVDGNKPQATTAGRAATPGSPKQIPAQAGARINVANVTTSRGGQNKPQQQANQPMPPPPPGMMPPPMGFEYRPDGMFPIKPGNVPNMPNMPGMPPGFSFPFPPVPPNAKGGNFQPPMPPILPIPGGQRNGKGKGGGMFPMIPPGMPGMPPGMPIPAGGMPSGVGPGGSAKTRGFPGEMQTPQKLQQNKDGKPSGSSHGPPNQPHRDEQKRVNAQGHQGSRFGNAQNNQSRAQSNRLPHHDGDRRQRWGDNRSHVDRRQGYDRQSGDRDRSRGHDERGYGDRGDRGDRVDRGYDRRRWVDRDDGYDRRRGGGHESQRYSDGRRDYDRDRDREYRKRSMSGRDYDEDRKRSRR